MGIFSKFFGNKNNKEQETPIVEEKKGVETDNETIAPRNENVAEDTPINTAENEPNEQEVQESKAKKEVEASTIENSENAEVATLNKEVTNDATTPNADNGQIDLSKWRVQPKMDENAQQTQPNDEQMQVLLNCELGDDEIPDDRRKEIVEQTFKGPEGVKAFGQNTVLENLFIVSYMQNVMIPKAQEAKNENDLAVFKNLIGLYSRMLAAKLMRLPKWVAIGSKTTGFPFEMGRMALTLLSDKYADNTVEIMEKDSRYLTAKNEIPHDHFMDFIDFLRKCGYAGLAVADGRHPGIGLPLEFFYLDGNSPKISSMENPFLLGAMISFMQEIRRGVNVEKDVPENEREGYKQILTNLQGQMFYQIANATFILPAKKDNNGREINPIFQNQEQTEKMLAVYTDVQEMNHAFPMSDGWMSMPTPFEKVADMVNAMGGNGFLINNASIGVPVMKDMMNHILQMKAQEAKAKAEKEAETNNVDAQN